MTPPEPPDAGAVEPEAAGSAAPASQGGEPRGNSQPLLQCSEVVAGYGATNILHGVSLAVNRGEVVTIIGPNGSGKSTLMKAIAGLVRVRSGRVSFRDADVSHFPPQRIVREGLCYVPQVANVFPTLSIRENLEMGGFIRRGGSEERIQEMFRMFPDLGRRPNQQAGSLSGGQRQMLAIGRALMVEPTLLILDEPTAGLAPAIMHSTFEMLQDINRGGVSLLLVEQNTREALMMSDRGYVLAVGENRLEDKGSALLDHPELEMLYLGA